MNKQGAIRTRVLVSEENLGTIHHRKPDRGRGVGDCEAFTSIGLDDWMAYKMIKDMRASTSTKDKHVVITNIQTFDYSFYRRLSASWITTTTNAIDPNVATIEENFTELAILWHNETDCLSSPSRITGNDAYLKIISLGRNVIPLILEDLKERGGNWYKALRILSGDDPVPAEARGDIVRMKELWLYWGRERGYIN